MLVVSLDGCGRQASSYDTWTSAEKARRALFPEQKPCCQCATHGCMIFFWFWLLSETKRFMLERLLAWLMMEIAEPPDLLALLLLPGLSFGVGALSKYRKR